MRKALGFMVFAAILGLATTGSYFVVKKFLRDRQSALTLTTKAAGVPRRTVSTAESSQPRTREVTQRTVPGTAGIPSDPAAAGQAAIQRQLRTLEEINKINEMNRRLMDQQQRHDR